MENIRIQDDLFHYVNQKKIDELVIPDDMPQIGGFNTLHTEVEKLMINEYNQMCETNSYPNSYLESICSIILFIYIIRQVIFNSVILTKTRYNINMLNYSDNKSCIERI